MTMNLVSNLYDMIMQVINLQSMPGTYFQFGWPALSLSPADFKLTSDGPYDTNVAEETLSMVCNIAPTVNPLRFENSGFEIDDLYQILILGAVLQGADPNNLLANPAYKLFSDAQYEFVQAQKGSIRDPSVFYYSCRATPGDWYTETAALHWAGLSLSSATAKPVGADSPFIKMGGQRLVEEGLLKLRPTGQSSEAIKRQMQDSIKSIIGRYDPQRVHLSTTKPLDAIRRNAMKFSASAGRAVATRMAELAAAPTLKKDLRPSLAIANLGNLDRVTIDPKEYRVVPTNELTVGKRVALQRVLDKQLVPARLAPQSQDFQISCKFCLVNITRPWLKSALLNLKTWYMFGTQAGQYSMGTLENNTGMFPMLQTAFLAIRDLHITAKWSPQDLENFPRARYLGPFDISGAAVQHDSLHAPGLQIVGWLSRLNPILPPLSQPT